DVVVGAHLQAADAVVLGAAGGEDDHRQGGPALAQRRQHIEAVEARQQQVEQDEADAGPDRLLESADAVGRLGDLVAGGPQRVDDAAADGELVLDHHHAGLLRHVSSPAARSFLDIWSAVARHRTPNIQSYSGIVMPFVAACSRMAARMASSNALSTF